MKSSLFFIPTLFLFSIFVSPVHAQSTSLSISPTLLEIEASRPSTTEKNFNIKNLGHDGSELEIELIPFTQSELENGEAELILDKTKAQETQQFLRKSAKIFDGNEEVDRIILAPLQEKTLTLSLMLSQNEKVSDHYFSVVFTNKTEEVDSTNQSTSTRVLPGIATNVIFSIATPLKRTALIQEFSSPIFLNNGPVPFTIRIQNNVSKYIKPYGNIIIHNMFGQAIGKVELKPTIILSNTSRNFTNAQIENSININNTLRPKILTYWSEPILLGLYSATLNVVSNPDSDVITRKIYFIGFPMNYILGITISIIILLFIAGKVRAKRKK